MAIPDEPVPSDQEPTMAVPRVEDDRAPTEVVGGASRTAARGLPARIGRYRIGSVLGAGGYGTVYRATHEQSGEEVALKTVRISLAPILKGIRREIGALARIRHPGIVRIVDDGLDDAGLPWYAMELCDGVPLRRFVPADAADPIVPVSTPEAPAWWTASLAASAPVEATVKVEAPAVAADLLQRLAIVRRLCVPLAYLHGEGLVHRDLKPDNVLVMADGTPVLVDFGLAQELASETGRDALEVMVEASGTLPYMAPEQGLGGVVDARADLYSLGCVLYELVTGRPPFLAKGPTELLWMHMKVEPIPPSRHRKGIHPGLDDLVMRLLAKEPRHRIGFAEDVASSLAELGAGADEWRGAPRPRPYLYRADLAGRESIYDALSAMIAGLGGGPGAPPGGGGVVLIAGESGAGKTRILTELATDARRRGIDVLGGECAALSADARAAGVGELGALRKPLQAIADRCQDLGGTFTRRLLGVAGPALVPYEPCLARLPGLDAASLPPLGAEAARLRLYHALASVFLGLAMDRPLVLVLDDLQWADELTLGFLGTLAAMPLSRLLVVSAYRAEEATGDIARLRASAGVRSHTLERLDVSAVGEVVADMLAISPPPQDLVDRVAAESEGNPLFVAEYLRAAVAEGWLSRDGHGRFRLRSDRSLTGSELQMPRSLRDLILRRIEGLSAGAGAMLDLLSVLGREVETGLVDAAAPLALPSADAGDLLGELAAAGVVEDGTGSVRIAHDKIREVSYARVSAARKVALHDAVARAIESWAGDRRADHLAALGHHLERAGRHAEAMDCYHDAAQRALGKYALAEAERLFAAYLALETVPTPRGIRARATLGGRVLFVSGKSDAAQSCYEEALALARSIGDLAGAGICLDGLGIVHQDCGRVLEAEKLYREAVLLHEKLGSRRALGNSLANLAAIPSQLGRIAESEELYRKALEIQTETGDRLGQGMTSANLAQLAMKRGSVAESRALAERGLAIYREVGHRRFEGLSLAQLGDVCAREGDSAAARAYYESGIAVMREVGDRRWEGITLPKMGLLALTEGRLDEVVPCFERGLAILRDVRDRWSEGNATEELATALGTMGRADEARARWEEALAIHREVENDRGIAAAERALGAREVS